MPRLTNVAVEYVSLVDRAAVRDPANPTEPQRFLLYKRDSGETTTGGDMPNEETAAALTKAEEERDALKKDAEELTAKVEKLEADLAEAKKAEAPKPEPAAVDKSDLPEAARIALEKAETDRADALRKAEEAERIAKEERNIRITGEYVAKAQELGALPVDAATFGPVLKAAAEKLTAEEAAELDRVLKAADEQLRTSALLKEYGRSGDPAPQGGDDVVARKAQEIRKSEPALSQFEALNLARRDPEVQRALIAAR